MIGNILFFAGVFLSGSLVWRALAAGWWRKYPIVFAYFTLLLLHAGAEWLVYEQFPALYARFYLIMEAVFLVFGFGLIWQVYAAIPHSYPGAGRVVKTIAQRVAAVAPLFLAAAIFFATPGSMTLDLIERNFRILHAVLILVVYGLAQYFSVPLSQNLEALLRGYGLYTAAFILKFTLWPLKYQEAWGYILPLAFLVSLIIWLVGLWRYKDAATDPQVLDSLGKTQIDALLAQLKQQLHAPFAGD